MPGEREDQTPTSGEPSSPDQRPAQSVFGNRGDLSFLGEPTSPPARPITPFQAHLNRPSEENTSRTTASPLDSEPPISTIHIALPTREEIQQRLADRRAEADRKAAEDIETIRLHSGKKADEARVEREKALAELKRQKQEADDQLRRDLEAARSGPSEPPRPSDALPSPITPEPGSSAPADSDEPPFEPLVATSGASGTPPPPPPTAPPPASPEPEDFDWTWEPSVPSDTPQTTEAHAPIQVGTVDSPQPAGEESETQAESGKDDVATSGAGASSTPLSPNQERRGILGKISGWFTGESGSRPVENNSPQPQRTEPTPHPNISEVENPTPETATTETTNPAIEVQKKIELRRKERLALIKKSEENQKPTNNDTPEDNDKDADEAGMYWEKWSESEKGEGKWEKWASIEEKKLGFAGELIELTGIPARYRTPEIYTEIKRLFKKFRETWVEDVDGEEETLYNDEIDAIIEQVKEMEKEEIPDNLHPDDPKVTLRLTIEYLESENEAIEKILAGNNNTNGLSGEEHDLYLESLRQEVNYNNKRAEALEGQLRLQQIQESVDAAKREASKQLRKAHGEKVDDNEGALSKMSYSQALSHLSAQAQAINSRLESGALKIDEREELSLRLSAIEMHYRLLREQLAENQDTLREDLDEVILQKAGALKVNDADIREEVDQILGRVSNKNLVRDAFRELWDDSYGLINFNVKDREEMLEALKQYVDFIDSKIAGVGDANKIIQNISRIRELVARNVKKTRDLSEDEAKGIADNVEARLVMFLHNEFAKVGQVDSAAALKKHFWTNRGRERLLSLFESAEVGGYPPELLMKALDLIAEDPRFELYFRPFGPRGELTNAAYAQGYLRDAIMELFIDELMHWEVAGVEVDVSDISDPKEQKRAKQRADRHKKVNAKNTSREKDDAEFNQLYVRRDDLTHLTPEKLKDLKKTAKKVAGIAFTLNSFLGEQIERRGASIKVGNGPINPETGEADGDYVHRRHAEYFVKFAIMQYMKKNDLSPIKLQKELIERAKVGARTPRIVDIIPELEDVINDALNEIWSKGNAASLIDAEGNTVYLQELPNREESIFAYDAFIANDHPLRTRILSDRIKKEAQEKDNNGNWKYNTYIHRLRRVVDPRFELSESKDDEIGIRTMMEAVDITHRLQAESSMHVFSRFYKYWHQGSQGAGPLTETRLYYMRDSLLATSIANIKYGKPLAAYLPEIYPVVRAFGCRSVKEFVQATATRNPKRRKQEPEGYESFSGEIRASEYEHEKMIRSVILDMVEKDKKVKGLMHEILSSRDKLIGYTPKDISDDRAKFDELLGLLEEKVLAKLFAIIRLTEITFSDERKAEPLNPAYWMAGILFDEVFDWLVSDESGDDRDRGGAKAYEAHRVAQKLVYLREVKNDFYGQTIEERLKEKYVAQVVKFKQAA